MLKALDESRTRWSSPAEPLFGLVTNNRSRATAKPFQSFVFSFMPSINFEHQTQFFTSTK